MDTKYVNTFNFYDFSSLQQLKRDADNKNEDSLKVIASQLESVFLQLVMKNMQDANESFKSDIFSRDNEDFYQDMLNQQMALSLSKAGGIGLADMIVKQLQSASKNITEQLNFPLKGDTCRVGADNNPEDSSVKDIHDE